MQRKNPWTIKVFSKEATVYTNMLLLRIIQKPHRPGLHLLASRREYKNARPGTAVKAHLLRQQNAFWSSLVLVEWAVQGGVTADFYIYWRGAVHFSPWEESNTWKSTLLSSAACCPSLWKAHLIISSSSPFPNCTRCSLYRCHVAHLGERYTHLYCSSDINCMCSLHSKNPFLDQLPHYNRYQ